VNNHKHVANAGQKNVQVAQAKACTHWTDSSTWALVHEWTADAKPLMFLDLKLGNICNLEMSYMRILVK
jgi:hypothetical protein